MLCSRVLRYSYVNWQSWDFCLWCRLPVALVYWLFNYVSIGWSVDVFAFFLGLALSQLAHIRIEMAYCRAGWSGVSVWWSSSNMIFSPRLYPLMFLWCYWKLCVHTPKRPTHHFMNQTCCLKTVFFLICQWSEVSGPCNSFCLLEFNLLSICIPRYLHVSLSRFQILYGGVGVDSMIENNKFGLYRERF